MNGFVHGRLHLLRVEQFRVLGDTALGRAAFDDLIGVADADEGFEHLAGVRKLHADESEFIKGRLRI